MHLPCATPAVLSLSVFTYPQIKKLSVKLDILWPPPPPQNNSCTTRGYSYPWLRTAVLHLMFLFLMDFQNLHLSDFCMKVLCLIMHLGFFVQFKLWYHSTYFTIILWFKKSLFQGEKSLHNWKQTRFCFLVSKLVRKKEKESGTKRKVFDLNGKSILIETSFPNDCQLVSTFFL